MTDAIVRPLIVDLDGTLIKSDLLVETALLVVSQKPLSIRNIPYWLCRGKAKLKENLANITLLDVSSLPYVSEVLEFVEDARQKKRPVILVSASDQALVEQVANHLDLFDDAVGSKDGQNLAGQNKADYLVERFGYRGFDYVGDSDQDWPVWDAAHSVVTAGAGERLVRNVERAFPDSQHIAKEGSKKIVLSEYVRSLRPHQWLKNLLVFIPLLTGHFFTPISMIHACIAFVAFSMLASAVYLTNDLLDLPHDRLHPRKKNRPLAAGAMPLLHGVCMTPLLVGGAFGLSLALLPLEFSGVLLFYGAMTFAYSIVLKRRAIIDVMVLAGLYSLRVIAGAAAISALPSPWLLAFSIFLFLSLAIVKRQTELIETRDSGREQLSGRAYNVSDLPLLQSMSVASGFLAVLVFALYLSSPAVVLLYKSPFLLWGICPLLLYWLSRVFFYTSRGWMHDDPVVFAATDRISLVIGSAVMALLIAGTVL